MRWVSDECGRVAGLTHFAELGSVDVPEGHHALLRRYFHFHAEARWKWPLSEPGRHCLPEENGGMGRVLAKKRVFGRVLVKCYNTPFYPSLVLGQFSRKCSPAGSGFARRFSLSTASCSARSKTPGARWTGSPGDPSKVSGRSKTAPRKECSVRNATACPPSPVPPPPEHGSLPAQVQPAVI